MRLRWTLITIIAAMAMSAFGPVLAASLQVEPARFVLQVDPGGRSGGAVQVINPNNAPMALTAKVGDWDLSDTGRFIGLAPGASSASMADWIRFNPRSFTIPPRSRQTVRFSVSVPRGVAPGERRSVLFFEQKASSPQGSGAVLISQIGVVVYAAVKPVRRNFSVTVDRVSLGAEGQSEVRIRVKAEGNAHCRVRGLFRLYDAGGKQTDEGQFAQQVILPGREMMLQSQGTQAGLVRESGRRLFVELAVEGVPNIFRRDFQIIMH